MIASYLWNALADLLDAAASIVRGANEATAKFEDEPGEYRLIFTRLSPDKLHICILWFGDTFSTKLDLEGKKVFEAECRLRTFAGAILSASQRVLEENGIEGYQEKWVNHEFPIHLQAKLQKALNNK
ncbi:MAG: hypothetical protein AAF383_14070 [Cyanobacteria bacterium P01_A01_bin.83]